MTTQPVSATARPQELRDEFCPNCKCFAYGIQKGIRWCPRCGTLIHLDGDAWFQAGEYSTPRLVETLKDQSNSGAFKVLCEDVKGGA